MMSDQRLIVPRTSHLRVPADGYTQPSLNASAQNVSAHSSQINVAIRPV